MYDLKNSHYQSQIVRNQIEMNKMLLTNSRFIHDSSINIHKQSGTLDQISMASEHPEK